MGILTVEARMEALRATWARQGRAGMYRDVADARSPCANSLGFRQVHEVRAVSGLRWHDEDERRLEGWPNYIRHD